MHYYQFNIGDYRRDTQHLTPLEHGIYRLLIDQYYLTEKPINANALRLLCIRSATEIEIAENILNEFFTHVGDGDYVHTRIDAEIEKFKEKSIKAKASAKKRWDANAMRTHSEGSANHKPITNNHKPINRTKKFSPPSLDEVAKYCEERQNRVDPNAWMDFYTSNGWKVGKNSMKDWKAAVRTWEKREKSNEKDKRLSAPDRIREANRRSAARRGDPIDGEIV